MTTHDTPLLPRMAVGSKTGVNRLKTKLLLVSGGVRIRESNTYTYRTARGGLEGGWPLPFFLFCVK